MRIGTSRRFVSIAAGAAALGLSALFAGHLAAHQARTGPGGDGWAPRAYRRAVRQLGLSAEQQTRIRGILESHADEILAQRKAGMERRRALRAATLAQPLDEAAIRQRARELSEVRADGAVLFARIRAEVWPILTAEQQEKATGMLAKRRDRGERRLEAFERWLRQNG